MEPFFCWVLIDKSNLNGTFIFKTVSITIVSTKIGLVWRPKILLLTLHMIIIGL